MNTIKEKHEALIHHHSKFYSCCACTKRICINSYSFPLNDALLSKWKVLRLRLLGFNRLQSVDALRLCILDRFSLSSSPAEMSYFSLSRLNVIWNNSICSSFSSLLNLFKLSILYSTNSKLLSSFLIFSINHRHSASCSTAFYSVIFIWMVSLVIRSPFYLVNFVTDSNYLNLLRHSTFRFLSIVSYYFKIFNSPSILSIFSCI